MNCKYWERLGSNKEAWGICNWFDRNESPPLPFWVVKSLPKQYGSISPTQGECDVFDKMEDEK